MSEDHRTAWIRPPRPVADGLRIGLLGGSFNPAHDGHLHVSDTAIKTLGLDYVWWLVSPLNPLKPAEDMADLKTRVTAARALIRHRRVVVTTIEAELDTRYTADTLARLRRRFSRTRFVWLMGSDNLLQIPLWRNWKAVFRSVPVAVVARPGSALKARCGRAARMFRDDFVAPDRRLPLKPAPAWTIIDWRRSDTSATEIRERALQTETRNLAASRGL